MIALVRVFGELHVEQLSEVGANLHNAVLLCQKHSEAWCMHRTIHGCDLDAFLVECKE